METFDLVVIGGGIVGMASTYKFQKENPDARILVLEKEKAPALHQTGRNSGVIHSGIYYKPGSLKATTCLEGYSQLIDFAQENKVKHEICGKVIVATKESEFDSFDRILARGAENGLEGIRAISTQELKEIEPYADGLKAIFVPHTGIIDYPEMTRKMGERVLQIQPKSQIRYSEAVTDVHFQSNQIEVHTAKSKFTAKHLISCAGLQSDRLARLDGLNPQIRIVPFRGDYYELAEHAWKKVKNLIYPVPDPNFPFLGVHFTRMVHGGAECGPNAVFSFAREGYEKTDFNLKDTTDSLGFPGTWKLFAKHWRYGLGEYERAFSKKKFLKALQVLMPSLEMTDLVEGRSGIRAQALDKSGNLVDDFVIQAGEKSVHILNAPSPAATASLAIADRVLAELKKQYSS